MRTTIQKWGNSLAVRIPTPIAKDLGMTSGTVADLAVEKGKIVITPQKEPAFTLKELLKDVTKRNLHAEADWGEPVGREAW